MALKQLPAYGLGWQRNHHPDRSWLRSDILVDLKLIAFLVNLTYMVVDKQGAIASMPPDLLIFDCANQAGTNLDGHPLSSHCGLAFDCSYYCNTYLFATAFIVALVALYPGYSFRVSSVAYPQIMSVLKKRKEFNQKAVEYIQKGYKGRAVLTVDDKNPHWDHIHCQKDAL